MALIVMKFGGSSVADTQKLKTAAEKIIAKRNRNNKVVVVVSAPGDMTDDLITRANEITRDPDEREMDMLLATGEQISIALLSMAIKDRGYDSISLTGPQAGIYADSSHTTAKITAIKPQKIMQELARGRIVIVAGFQGLNPNDDITTLGRGGSDLTAVALAAAVKAKVCEIYTDVDGVYTADPRICQKARKLPFISYDEMLEAAGLGAQVMQARSIQVAKKFDVKIEVRCTFNNNPGTIIYGEEDKRMEEVVVTSIPYDKNQVKLSIIGLPDKPGVAARLFGALARKNVNVDMIIQSAARGGYNDISFTVTGDNYRKARPLLKGLCRSFKAQGITSDDEVAKVSIVGVGMRSHPGVASKMFETLAEEDINIEMISTSEIKISCVIKKSQVNKAVCALHKAFGLDRK